MKDFTRSNSDVLIGLTIIMSVFIILEVVTEFIMAIIWTNAIKDPIITVYVMFSTIFYCIPGVVSVCNMVKQMCTDSERNAGLESSDTENSTGNDATNKTLTKKSITTLPLYSFIWLASYFAYLLLYSFFPAFILAFAYPIRVISIFVFMATFMVLFTVCVITYLKRDVKLFPCAEWVKEKSDKKFKREGLHVATKFVIGCFIALNFLYFFLFVFGLLYSLIIGRASVVSSAPLALLSLLPSILVSAMAWIIKKTVLDDKAESNEKQKIKDKATNTEEATIVAEGTTTIGTTIAAAAESTAAGEDTNEDPTVTPDQPTVN